MVHGDAYYLLHLYVKKVKTLEYSDENSNSGKFNSSYSGAANKLCAYTITFDIRSVERVNLYLPN